MPTIAKSAGCTTWYIRNSTLYKGAYKNMYKNSKIDRKHIRIYLLLFPKCFALTTLYKTLYFVFKNLLTLKLISLILSVFLKYT